MENMALDLIKISSIEENKYLLEDSLEKFSKLNDENLKKKLNEMIPNEMDAFEMFLLIKRCEYCFDDLEFFIGREYKGNEISIKCKAQKEFCENEGIPLFAPEDGICWSCDKQIYNHINLYEASHEHITGCPHCSHSYCD